ncbi:MAG TPA: tRNA (cytidine(34)-2'-O)-methyltransferase [Polyangium sp.]|nr:tRNA (cytidine(34)-2'-O)-methyltransferase [Polyangium sp.]
MHEWKSRARLPHVADWTCAPNAAYLQGLFRNKTVAKDQRPRLRARPLDTPLHVVLVEPEIPQNTGNIARLTAATKSRLHLVGKLGFRIDEHAVRRAGVDYWHLVDLETHPDFDHFTTTWPDARIHLFSAIATKSYLEADFRPGDALVFGKESVGLDDALLERYPDRVYGIPTLGPVRSLNLANASSIVLYEALRHIGALADAKPG